MGADNKKVEPKKVSESEFKTYLGLIMIKLGQQKQKKIKEISNKRKEIANLLTSNQLDFAKLKMENIITYEKLIVIYDILNAIYEGMTERVTKLLKSDTCPEELKASIVNILYCCDSIEIKEMQKIKEAIQVKYGVLFVNNACNNTDKLVNPVIIKNLSLENTPNNILINRMKQIVIEDKIDYFFPQDYDVGGGSGGDVDSQNFFPSVNVPLEGKEINKDPNMISYGNFNSSMINPYQNMNFFQGDPNMYYNNMNTGGNQMYMGGNINMDQMNNINYSQMNQMNQMNQMGGNQMNVVTLGSQVNMIPMNMIPMNQMGMMSNNYGYMNNQLNMNQQPINNLQPDINSNTNFNMYNQSQNQNQFKSEIKTGGVNTNYNNNFVNQSIQQSMYQGQGSNFNNQNINEDHTIKNNFSSNFNQINQNSYNVNQNNFNDNNQYYNYGNNMNPYNQIEINSSTVVDPNKMKNTGNDLGNFPTHSMISQQPFDSVNETLVKNITVTPPKNDQINNMQISQSVIIDPKTQNYNYINNNSMFNQNNIQMSNIQQNNINSTEVNSNHMNMNMMNPYMNMNFNNNNQIGTSMNFFGNPSSIENQEKKTGEDSEFP